MVRWGRARSCHGGFSRARVRLLPSSWRHPPDQVAHTTRMVRCAAPQKVHWTTLTTPSQAAQHLRSRGTFKARILATTRIMDSAPTYLLYASVYASGAQKWHSKTPSVM